ncbi:MAG: ABC transporter ATP-binding protein/permease [Gammaproteobacteria bacterium]|uniref:Putative ABC transporter ATP-binding protein n=1 Tax=viral metagenome TaxID=1070528 RepID=A0A6M3XH63_9ZZZZ|nr:ABC transporter ATP-binding protein/permease [Gammaproteobacteria bacterium]MBU2236442.1 ABC transporter ATP-binding protein/permease [Gammaproteobacteria bacterium]MBU2320922.1 ABC transporter ATP-binding protein/permease [Gammaproteobacteria bacterium]MBU2411506.1 ABC transporter ATP-binding protein/permease [Gammaproteobacteria bacterium]
MFSLGKEIFNLMSGNQKRRFYLLQSLVIFMTLSELIGIASIAPFMALVGNQDILHGDNILSRIYHLTNINNEQLFVIYIGMCVLLTLLISSLVSMYTTWKLSLFSTKIGTEVASSLYVYYLNQNWLYHSENNSADLTKKIVNETDRMTMQIILPFMLLISRLFFGFIISVSLFLYDPAVVIVGLLVFLIAYIVLFKKVRKSLNFNGQSISSSYSTRYRLINEALGGIKDVILLERQKVFTDRFDETGRILAHGLGANNAISLVPRFAVELLAFGSMITLVLVLLNDYEGDLGKILPVLSVYVLAGLKLLPAFQQIYANLAQIKGALPSYNELRKDLILAKKWSSKTSSTKNEIAQIQTGITLRNISFYYPNSSIPAVKDINTFIPAKKVIGIVGPSGSGKSTLIDIILTLISDKGEVLVDGVQINDTNKASWRKKIGFVPQSIFLTEGSIAENVAFGIGLNEIDRNKVKMAINLAHLTDTVDQLDNGLDTLVGERGVKLSGGQRQRIGIARALYHDAEVIVFDEATSALDGITEKLIMDAINDFSGDKTIIMIAHRLKTVKKCDQILFVDKGAIVDQGTYDDLYSRNQQFKQMADHS